MGGTPISSHLGSLIPPPPSSHLAFTSQETDLAETEGSRPGQRALWNCPFWGGEAMPRTLDPTWISFCSWVASREQVGTALVKEVLYDWQATPSVCRGVPQLGVFSQYWQWTHFLLSCSFKSNYVHTIAIQSVFVYSFSIILNLRWLCTPIIIPST